MGGWGTENESRSFRLRVLEAEPFLKKNKRRKSKEVQE
jgi:hypothetical protein